jgi:hypothetical protein
MSFQKVKIVWDDPFGIDTAWTSPEELKNQKPNPPHKTLGYLIPNKLHGLGKNWIVVAGTVAGSTDGYGGITCIPKNVIKKIEKLK